MKGSIRPMMLLAASLVAIPLTAKAQAGGGGERARERFHG